MIDYNPKSWLKLIFAFHKSDTFRILWKEIVYIGLFTTLVVFLEIKFFPDAEVLEKLIGVYSLIGFVISLLLVFRTNTAYDRWWEGRRKWGELVNDSRNLSIKLSGILKEESDRDFFRRMISNFAFASKEHLRSGVEFKELNLNSPEHEYLRSKQHVPLAIAEMMFSKISSLKSDGTISEVEVLYLERNLNSLMDSLGGCERIKNTPIPFSYSLFIKKFIFVYVITLPLAFVQQFGYFAALISTFIFYILVSMEVLAEEIEDPFGTDDNDLPTDQLCLKIKESVEQVFKNK
jgi:putative membrane protein